MPTALLEQEQVEQSIDQEREQVRFDVFHTLKRLGIKTPEELDFFFKEYLHITIPKKKICPEHMSPFEVICDLYFNKPAISLWISARGSGKTFTIANLDVAQLITKGLDPKKPLEILHSAAIQYQADRGYEHFVDAVKDPLIYDELKTDPTQKKTVFMNGSSLGMTVMTYSGTNSPHPPLLILDEVELVRDWKILQEALCIPQSKHGHKAQTIMISSRKWDNGIVQRLFDESGKRGIKVYQSCIFEVLEQCTRLCFKDPVYGDCPVYERTTVRADGSMAKELLCGGVAHGCDGFYTIDDFIGKCTQLDYETLDAQYFCKKPVGYKGGYVFADRMHDNIQIVDWNKFKELTGYDRPPDKWDRFAGVDFESVFVYTMYAIEPLNGRRWCYQEYYWDGNMRGIRLLEDHAEGIKQLQGWTKKVRSFGDPSAKQEIFELKRKGVPCERVRNNDLKLGVNEVRRLLQIDNKLVTPMLMFIGNETAETIKSMRSWTYFKDKDGNIDYDNFSEEDDHGADAVRYGHYGFKSRPHTTLGRAKGLY